MSDNIKVVVKVRPLIPREIEENLSFQWRVDDNTLYQVDHNGRDSSHSFTFDKVYGPNSKTSDIYNDIAKPIVEAATGGFNGTIFAYGQTSSGKTYTMTGTENSPGIIPQAVYDLFSLISDKEDRAFLLRVSFIEIYNETIKDLLDVDKKVKIQETLQGGVKLDCTEKVMSSPEEVISVMKMGEANRKIGATNMNEKSSRSHSIFQITIESRKNNNSEGDEDGGRVNVSILNLVDLAGSERAGQSGATGIRFREGTHINKSLLSLSLVINTLAEDCTKFINFRDSKLTRILQNSLGGNAKTSIICAITPAAVDESISTLQFASRAKAIKNKPKVNEVATKETMIQKLIKKLSELQSDLEGKKNLEQDNRMLNKKIEDLQRQILNGFGQRYAIDVSKADRRKTWCAPRRMTIDTLHSIDEDDTVPSIRRFCTPALKYNPAQFGMDFATSQKSSLKLPRVSEESSGLVTPPNAKEVNFGDVIVIDCDDDDSLPNNPCSPIHKCYDASKTPPCVLREKAKKAETKLNDIIELSGKELRYAPHEAELMKTLENNTNIILKLEEKVNSLNIECNEKDTKIDKLKDQINQVEAKVAELHKEKEEIEKTCKLKTISLTDLEVSYENFKTKYKMREEELLALLEEKHNDVPKEGKYLKEFMDMSKEISLVNSDIESSMVVNNSGSAHPQLQDLVSDLQSELNSKAKLVTDLEAELVTYKHKVATIEETNTQLTNEIKNLSRSFKEIEAENVLCQSTIKELKSGIEKQTEILDTANNDIICYNNTIKELVLKLQEKDKKYNILEETTLENFVSIEEKFLARNENLKNIVFSLKNYMQICEKEITDLKAVSQDVDIYKEQLIEKEETIKKFEEEIAMLNAQIIQNEETIKHHAEENSKLLEQNSNLSNKIKNLYDQNDQQDMACKEQLLECEKLQVENDKYAEEIIEKETIIADINKRNVELTDLVKKISEEKTTLLENIKLNQKNTEDSSNLKYVKLINTWTYKVHSVISNLKNETVELKPLNEIDIDPAISDFMENMNILLNLAEDIKQQNKKIAEYQNIISDMEIKIQDLNKLNHANSEKCANLNIEIQSFKGEIKILQKNLEQKSIECANLQDVLTEKESNITLLVEMEQNLMDEVKSLKADSEEYKQISILNNELKIHVESFKGEIKILQKNLEEKSIECANLQDVLAKKESNITLLVETEQNLMDEVKRLKADSEEYKQISELNNDLKIQVESSKGEIKCLQKNLEEKSIECANLQDVLAEKESNLTLLVATEQNLMDEVKSLKADSEEYKQISELNNDLKIQVECLMSELCDLKKNLEENTKEFDCIRNKDLEYKEKILELKQILSDRDCQLSKFLEKEALLEDVENLKLQSDNTEQKRMLSEIEELRKNLELKTKECDTLLNQTLEINEKLLQVQKSLNERDAELNSLVLKEQSLLSEIENLKETSKENYKLYQQIVDNFETTNLSLSDYIKQQEFVKATSDNTINSMLDCIDNVNKSIFDKHAEIMKHVRLILEHNVFKDNVINKIRNKVMEIHKIVVPKSNENLLNFDDNSVNVPKLLDDVFIEVKTLLQNVTNNKNTENEQFVNDLTAARTEIKALTTQNFELMTTVARHEAQNHDVGVQIQDIRNENSRLENDLLQCNSLIKQLINELTSKISELKDIDSNAKQLELQLSRNLAKNELIDDLQVEKEKLIKKRLELEKEIEMMLSSFELSDESVRNNNSAIQKAVSCTTDNTNVIPPSLLNMCLNKVVTVLNYRDSNQSNSVQKSNLEVNDLGNSATTKELYEKEKHIRQLTDDNEELRKSIDFLRSANNQLIEERNETQIEIQLLLEPAYELQKKIVNHRTNLSTLTATTYAENKALQSQVKVLQHHHSRLHHVCEKDVSIVKQKLVELYKTLERGNLSHDFSQNSFKRYSLPDVLDKDKIDSTLKNESTFDGDLLMLDTNVTMTSANSTLVNYDQSCFELTQGCLNDSALEPNYQNLTLAQTTDILESFKQENIKLKNQIEKMSTEKVNKPNLKDAQSSPFKFSNQPDVLDNKNDIEQLTLELSRLTKEKEDFQKKYEELSSKEEMTEALRKKVNILEKDLNNKLLETTKLKDSLKKLNNDMRHLQDENDTLSTQLMENISEADDLKKELTTIKDKNTELIERCSKLEQNISDKEENYFISKPFSQNQKDMDTSVRYNKICSLQNELHASKEDCKKITEEVATIKNHLERSNLSITQNMDDSMGESNIFTFTRDFSAVDSQNAAKFPSHMANITEEKSFDAYEIDKMDCFNYLIEITGAEKENLNHDAKIIDVMKMFYNKLTNSHGASVEILINNLKQFEEEKDSLERDLTNLKKENELFSKNLLETKQNFNLFNNILSQLKNTIDDIITHIDSPYSVDYNLKLVNNFKDKILKVLDREFALDTTLVFESLIDSIASKHQNDLSKTMGQYTNLEDRIENLMIELRNCNNNLNLMKDQLSKKEEEYNLLKSQKEKIHEISGAVTLDIVKKEQLLNEVITKGCRILLENNIVNLTDADKSLPHNEILAIIFDRLLESHKIKEENETTLRLQIDKLNENYKIISLDMAEKENDLEKQLSLNTELKDNVEKQDAVLKQSLDRIKTLTEELDSAKHSLSQNDVILQSLPPEFCLSTSVDSNKLADFVNKVKYLKEEVTALKTVNDVIIKEKEHSDRELNKAQDVISAKNVELDSLNNDIISLRSSLKDKLLLIENLTLESNLQSENCNSLKNENFNLTAALNDMTSKHENKCAEVNRLQINIKTHEKSVQIQSGMVKRLQKQKQIDSKSIEELTSKCSSLQQEIDSMVSELTSAKEELNSLKQLNEKHEICIADLEKQLQSHKRNLFDPTENSRRRRQSLNESKRLFAENIQEDYKNMEAVFGTRSQPDDLFMDVDEDNSNRSTPARNVSDRKRDSLAAISDQSESDSRPSSVISTRRRRQSVHDLHRSILVTPSPRESIIGSKVSEELTNVESESELSQLKVTLLSCQKELEELKEKYKELDDECETCAEYLKERDAQCLKLKKEKVALEASIAELKQKLESQSTNETNENTSKRCYTHVAVNTDEDWANLHSVVVDRMSFDLEVEKNKKLTKAIEEFHLKNRDLKSTLAKMQKVIEKTKDGSATAKELESTKQELRQCKEELAQLKQSYTELDEECATCAEYLAERDEHIVRLKGNIAALEGKLTLLKSEVKVSPDKVKSRTKRRSLHDTNREIPSTTELDNENSIELSNYESGCDDSSRFGCGDSSVKEVKRLSLMVSKLSQQKLTLQQKLAESQNSNPLYVATGSAIVQDQQLDDIMRENQKLKKINAKLISVCKKRGKDKEELKTEDKKL